MPKVAAYTIRWASAQHRYEVYEHSSATALTMLPESPEWFVWLDLIASFTFAGQSGYYTAHKETKQRGDVYWHAYRRTRGKLTKKYLGKTADLTLARLEDIARLLTTNDQSGTQTTQEISTQQADTLAFSSPRRLRATAIGDADIAPSQHDALLVTKLRLPRPPRRLVHRPHLTERLQQVLERPLTLIAAPAGFGKTTLLSTWLVQTPVSAAWVSLDSADDELTRFWSYTLAALDSVFPGCGTNALALLQSPQPPAMETILTRVINALTAMPQEVALIWDDYHLVTTHAIHTSVTYLLDHLPPHLHLIIATRADPPLPLARLRTRAQLVEIRSGDLRFTSQEVAAFLVQVHGLSLAPEDIIALEVRTEGWIAGLQLAALSLQGRQDVHDAEIRARADIPCDCCAGCRRCRRLDRCLGEAGPKRHSWCGHAGDLVGRRERGCDHGALSVQRGRSRGPGPQPRSILP